MALDIVERERGRALIERRITLVGALDEAQRARLLQIAEACPVHRILTGEVAVRTDIAGAQREAASPSAPDGTWALP